MNGLDLESFLWLLRADRGAWALLGAGTSILCLLAWLSWGSRRALRKCVALSVVAHAGLALYGSTVPSVFRALGPTRRDPLDRQHIRTIRVTPSAVAQTDRTQPSDAPASGSPTRPASGASSPDLVIEHGKLADARLDAAGLLSHTPHDVSAGSIAPARGFDPLPLAAVVPTAALPPITSTPEQRNHLETAAPGLPVPGLAAPTAAQVAQLAPEVEKLKEVRGATTAIPATALSGLAAADLRRESIRDPRSAASGPLIRLPDMRQQAAIPLPRANPSARPPAAIPAPLADLTGPSGSPGLTEVPQIYRSRLDVNRSARAQVSGASASSEQAVERALDWLARHQDADGRWDGATMREADGTPIPGDDDFTTFCPPGETCFGETAYWEADTGLTGLALLAYLGAGYTQKDGKYQTTVSKGIDWLLSQQKSDGDLRGSSKAVGMYCHAMAALAICESYALSLDDHLRGPAERAVSFLVRARAQDGQAWRYAPGAAIGDTSILGWVVMVFKSAREVGLRSPSEAEMSRGSLRWLERVATGQSRGLARYQPWDPVTPTMTAEAWVCRQFLGVGGPGASSTEAAAHLLKNESDRGDANFYYWYYGTLAMYQQGGPSWTRWNDRLRDRLVSLQRSSGHRAGSWDPDDSLYGARGGRIYCTALATLTLEVYYRYLRLYDAPSLPAEARVDGNQAPELAAPRSR